MNEIKGRMMEDIVLRGTKLANPKKQVFVLQFPIGELVPSSIMRKFIYNSGRTQSAQCRETCP